MKLLHPVGVAFLLVITVSCFGRELFHDDFEGDLGQWICPDDSMMQLHQTRDSCHKTVLKLIPNRTSHCLLIKGSETWKGVVIKGEILFPTEENNYFGLVYGYQENQGRIDFGCIYVKGNGSYIRVNPHLDGNATRTLYEEFTTSLDGDEAIHSNEWIPFKAEIIEDQCHLYVGQVVTPQIVFQYDISQGGMIGVKPRFAGGECWIDQITVNEIEAFSYKTSASRLPANYDIDALITNWETAGPFEQRVSEIETSRNSDLIVLEDKRYKWEPFNSDQRGCVLAGKVCRYTTPEKYAYFSTEIPVNNRGAGELQFSSVNNLYVWVNSKYAGSIERQRYAWYDFITNPEHKGKGLEVEFEKGANRVLVLVEGGQYGGDGFYMHVEKE